MRRKSTPGEPDPNQVLSPTESRSAERGPKVLMVLGTSLTLGLIALVGLLAWFWPKTPPGAGP